MTETELPDDCGTFAAAVNAVLDGDAPVAALAGGHADRCPDCRGLATAARLLAAAGPGLRTPPAPPPDLRPRLVRTVARSRRRRRVAPALAAAVAVGVGVWSARPPRPAPVAVIPVQPTPRLADQWAAVAGVARQASARAVEPARLFAPPAVTLPAAPPPPDTSGALASLGQAARTGAEPVAGTARRAVGLFLRDFGLASKPSS